MKKNILAIAIATAVAAPAAMADAKIYGYFNGAIENVTDNGTQMDSRNSRVGIKGSQDLGNGLSAIYQFEAGLDIMSGDFNNGDKGGMRNTFLGLNGGFGTVLMGKHDTPLRMIQPSDAFADGKYTGNNRSTFSGATGNAGEQRVNNALAYVSPDFNGVSFALAGAQLDNGDDASLTDAISASVAYGKKSDGLYLALGYTMVDLDSGEEADMIRLTAQYKADGLTAYGMYNILDSDSGYAGQFKNGLNPPVVDGEKGQALTLGVSYKIGDFTPKAKIAYVDEEDLGAADKYVNFAIGSDYNLGKNTKAFVEIAQISEDRAGLSNSGVAKNDDLTVFSIGMNHKF